MDDLISRQAALDALAKFVPYAIYDESTESYTNGLTDAHNLICQLPSAERTGRWTHVYDENEKLFFRNKWVCSACGESNTYGMSDFCPCCGAMMENSTRRMKEVE